MSNDAPSVFEVWAAEQLSGTLDGALAHVTSAVAPWLPGPIRPVVYEHADAISLSIRAAIELYHLCIHDALFAEAFFGLYRRPSSMATRLSWGQRACSLALELGLPRLLRAADAWHARRASHAMQFTHAILAADDDDEEIESRRRAPGWTERLATLLYPWLRALGSLACLAYAIAYMHGALDPSSPALHAVRCSLGRMQHTRFARNLGSVLGDGAPVALRAMLGALQSLVPAAVLALRVHAWSQSEGVAAARQAAAALPLPDPPPLPPPHPAGIAPARRPNECPLCRGELVNAAALGSGYVFCYGCARAHVDTERVCPVSRVPLPLAESAQALVRKLYDGDAAAGVGDAAAEVGAAA